MKTALISGAGIAGPAAAYWLNAAGWETTLIERAPEPREGREITDQISLPDYSFAKGR
ncbi:MAG TPA: hypothetical protein VGG29_11115 [Caulobacteraceae bacterium]|jgi:2-polyprenyl-6-methoxyphenol hydroxylase-like FAD-dependent oxidoreductase